VPFVTIGDVRYLTPAAVIGKYGIGRQTLSRWHDKGKLRAVTTPGGKHLYHSGDVEKLFHARDPAGTSLASPKEVLLYARVSSEHQRGDLGRQIDDLKRAYPDHSHFYQDVASGLNWKRPGLVALLDRVHKGGVGEVVVANKDRLARFGVELIEWFLRKADAKLVVLGHEERSQGEPERELADDLISIVTVFVAKHNGRRSADNRRKRKEASAAAGASKEVQEEEASESVDSREATPRQGQAHPGVPHHRGAGEAEAVDRHGEVDVQRVPQGHSKRRRSKEQEGSESAGSE
jgi:predicted site-specific integrase-resolvase